MNMFKVT